MMGRVLQTLRNARYFPTASLTIRRKSVHAGLQAGRVELRPDESIDRVHGLGRDLGHLGSLHRLERPPVAVLVRGRERRTGPRRDPAIGPDRPRLDPAREESDFRVLQLPLRRHLEFTGLPNRLNQQAFDGLAGRDRRAAVAALEQRRPRVQP